MSNIPDQLKYAKSHEWAQLNSDGTITVGITDHAQEMLGDLVYIELPAIGREVKAGQECAVVESVKAASDVYSPVSGKIVETNAALNDSPELVNKDAYAQGWLFRLTPANKAELETLLDAAAYHRQLDAEGQ